VLPCGLRGLEGGGWIFAFGWVLTLLNRFFRGVQRFVKGELGAERRLRFQISGWVTKLVMRAASLWLFGGIREDKEVAKARVKMN